MALLVAVALYWGHAYSHAQHMADSHARFVIGVGLTLFLGFELILYLVYRFSTRWLQNELEAQIQARTQSEQRLRTLVEVNQYSIQELDLAGNILYANPASAQMLGYSQAELQAMNVVALLPTEAEREQLRAELQRLVQEQPPPRTHYNRNRRQDGRIIDVQVDWNYKYDEAGQVAGFISVAADITAARRDRMLLDGRQRVLEMLARDEPLDKVLTAIVTYIEQIAPALYCSIHLLDHDSQTLTTAANLRLPGFYVEAVEGLAIGRGIGSCGTAAATGQRVIVEDVLSHPYWGDFRELMARTGFRACWSEPIRSRDGHVLGTFAIYTETAMAPGAGELELIRTAAELAAIVIDNLQAAEAIRVAEERARLILESTTEGIFGLDLEGRATFVNPAAADMLGYTPAELTGCKIHEIIHGYYPDGRPMPLDECRMLAASLRNQENHVADEVLWRKDGSCFPVEYWATGVHKDGLLEGAVVTFRDITARRQAEQEIEHLAYHDALTGLPNRRRLREQLDNAVTMVQRDGRWFALHLLDLDHFKDINDSLGHPVGDQLLCEVARRIGDIIRATDSFARLGGDEFALIQTHVEDLEDVAILAQKVIQHLTEPFWLEGSWVTTNTSIGIVVVEQDRNDVDELISRADLALYKAKDNGRGTFAFYEDTMAVALQHELTLARELTGALKQNELFLQYQPQFELVSGRLVGAEALLRWRHATRGVLAPADFLDVAEKRGLMQEIAAWVLREACRQGSLWLDWGHDFGRLALNLSTQQLSASGFAEQTIAELSHSGIDPECIELEFTEQVMLEANETARLELMRLSRLGVQVAIDDFGTGLSSLQNLRRFRADKIKIDREFIRDIDTDPNDAEIVKAAIALGNALGLITTAEGVEHAEQVAMLQRFGCQQAQGYWFGQPVSAEQFEANWLRGRPPHLGIVSPSMQTG